MILNLKISLALFLVASASFSQASPLVKRQAPVAGVPARLPQNDLYNDRFPVTGSLQNQRVITDDGRQIRPAGTGVGKRALEKRQGRVAGVPARLPQNDLYNDRFPVTGSLQNQRVITEDGRQIRPAGTGVAKRDLEKRQARVAGVPARLPQNDLYNDRFPVTGSLQNQRVITDDGRQIRPAGTGVVKRDLEKRQAPVAGVPARLPQNDLYNDRFPVTGSLQNQRVITEDGRQIRPAGTGVGKRDLEKRQAPVAGVPARLPQNDLYNDRLPVTGSLQNQRVILDDGRQIRPAGTA